MSTHGALSSSWAADEPWSRYTVLTLDGTEPELVSTLLNLQRLMDKIQEIETSQQPTAETSADSPSITSQDIETEFRRMETRYKKQSDSSSEDYKLTSRFLPCHYFDFVAGSSTGGLVALMLGRLRMSVDGALDKYRLVMRQMQYLRQVLIMPPSLDPAVPSRRSILQSTQTQISEILGYQLDSFKSDPDRCQTILFATKDRTIRNMPPYAVRSYGVHAYAVHSYTQREPASESLDCSIGDLVRGICRSPYRKQEARRNREAFSNMTFTTINPTKLVLREIRKSFAGIETDDTDSDVIGTVVSIGCSSSGLDPLRTPDTVTNFSRIEYYSVEYTIRCSIEAAELVHKDIQTHDEFDYFRIDARSPQDPEIPWNDEAALRSAAEELVFIRRQRSKLRKWESFAFGWSYRCIACENVGWKEPELKSRGQLFDHLFLDHKLPPVDSQYHEELKHLISIRTSDDGLTGW